MGVTAMQFRVDEDGNLVRDTAFPLPTRASQLFDGRSPVSEDYRKAYEREQNKSVDESAAPSTSEPVIENEGFLPGVKEESPQEERREERQDDDRGDDQAARGGEAPSPRS